MSIIILFVSVWPQPVNEPENEEPSAEEAATGGRGASVPFGVCLVLIWLHI